MNTNCDNPYYNLLSSIQCPPVDNCDEVLSSNCITYNGPDIPCLGLEKDMLLTDIIKNILHEVNPQCGD
jgi:hypothetical protein